MNTPVAEDRKRSGSEFEQLGIPIPEKHRGDELVSQVFEAALGMRRQEPDESAAAINVFAGPTTTHFTNEWFEHADKVLNLVDLNFETVATDLVRADSFKALLHDVATKGHQLLVIQSATGFGKGTRFTTDDIRATIREVEIRIRACDSSQFKTNTDADILEQICGRQKSA